MTKPPSEATAKPPAVAQRHAFGWNCRNCTFFHKLPGTRCSMCGELRVASRQEMRDFVLGKKIAPATTGNLVEILSHDDDDNNNNNETNDNSNERQGGPSTKENRCNHKPPASLPKPTASRMASTTGGTRTTIKRNPYFKSSKTNTTNPNRSIVRNPYSTGKTNPCPPKEPQQQKAGPKISQQQQQQQQQRNSEHAREAKDQRQTNAALKQHSFFDKKTAVSRPKKKAPMIHHFPFAPGPVAHHPDHALTYIYPKHPEYPTRDYQKEITETALNYNTLVSLPTGLGKTHIAAVVMYNFWRWFSCGLKSQGGKVIFLAPTLPLVNQQIEACYKITGIPGNETAVLTGRLKAEERKELWKSRRVFYCTPQTVQKDLLAACGDGSGFNLDRQNQPQQQQQQQQQQDSDHIAVREVDPDTAQAFSRVVCLVLDEAHKATGDYAYTRVVELLEKAAGAKFRIVGLSATPGTSIKAIQGVVEALRACKIEARTDADPSVAPYLHEKKTEIVICPRNTHQRTIGKRISDLVFPLLNRLREEKVLMHGTPDTLTAYSILKARQQYEQFCRSSNRRVNGGLISCFHATYSLIQLRNDCHQSLGVVKTKLLRLNSVPQKGILSSIVKSDEFASLLQNVLEITGGHDNANTNHSNSLYDVIDPKLSKLCELLKHHFERSNACNHSSRAIVFAQFRDSVQEIVHCLERTLKPLVRCRYFVGQNKGSNTNSKADEKVTGMKQAEQQKAIRDFRANVFNVLVCTSIGEEGLDIGDVDLIINYDVIRSPIRTIQRAGRTGRKRDGRVVCLIAEGPEQQTHKKRVEGEKTLASALKNPKKFIMASHYPMLPHTPILEYQMMQVQSKLNMKEVAGAQQMTPSGLSKTKAFKNAWRLTQEEEEKRQRHMGERVLSLPDYMNWTKLKRFFCKNRIDPSKHSSVSARGCPNAMLRNIRQSKESKIEGGRNTIILKRLEFEFGSTYAVGPTKVGYQAILEIFPIDAHPEIEVTKNQSSKMKLNYSVRKLTSRYKDTSAETDCLPKEFTTSVELPVLGLNSRKVTSNKTENAASTLCKILNKTDETKDAVFASDIIRCQSPSYSRSQSANDAIVNETFSKTKDCDATTQERNNVSTVLDDETNIFRLPTPPPSSDSSISDEDEDVENERCSGSKPSPSHDNTTLTTRSTPEQRILNPWTLHEKKGDVGNTDQLENGVCLEHDFQKEQNANNASMLFRLPTPPPSSSSSSESGGETDEEIESDKFTRIEQEYTDEEMNEKLRNPMVLNKDLVSSEGGKFESLEINSKHRQTTSAAVSEEFKTASGDALQTLQSRFGNSRHKQNDSPYCSERKNDDNSVSESTEGRRSLDTALQKKVEPPLLSSSLKSKFIEQVHLGKGVSKSERKRNMIVDESDSEDEMPLAKFKQNDGNAEELPRHRLCNGTHEPRRQAYPQILETPDSTDHIGDIAKQQHGIRIHKRIRIGTNDSDDENFSAQNFDTYPQTATPASTPLISKQKPFDTIDRSQTIALRQIDSKETVNGLTDTPIQVRNDVAGDIICQICQSGKSTETDPIVLCDKCDLGFHKKCYPVEVDINSSESWYCDECCHNSTGQDNSTSFSNGFVCTFCNQRGGVLRRDGAAWCHPLCLAFTSKISAASCEKCCLFGAVQCNLCSRAIHPYCALDSGWTILWSNPSESQSLISKLFCPAHIPERNGLNDGDCRIICSENPTVKRLKRKRRIFCSDQGKSIGENLSKKHLVQSGPGLKNVCPPDEDTRQKNEQARLKERRRQGMAKFVLEEAEIDSDEEKDNDQEEEALRRIEEEEGTYSQDSFINDDPCLSQHFSQDLLDRVDQDDGNAGFGYRERYDGNEGSTNVEYHHRTLDAQRDRENQFKTPNFNRRMMRPDSGTGLSTGSQHGLGRMNFIRSVLEHHRHGGDCDQIEAEYKRLEAMNGCTDSPSLSTPTI